MSNYNVFSQNSYLNNFILAKAVVRVEFEKPDQIKATIENNGTRVFLNSSLLMILLLGCSVAAPFWLQNIKDFVLLAFVVFLIYYLKILSLLVRRDYWISSLYIDVDKLKIVYANRSKGLRKVYFLKLSSAQFLFDYNRSNLKVIDKENHSRKIDSFFQNINDLKKVEDWLLDFSKFRKEERVVENDKIYELTFRTQPEKQRTASKFIIYPYSVEKNKTNLVVSHIDANPPNRIRRIFQLNLIENKITPYWGSKVYLLDKAEKVTYNVSFYRSDRQPPKITSHIYMYFDSGYKLTLFNGGNDIHYDKTSEMIDIKKSNYEICVLLNGIIRDLKTI